MLKLEALAKAMDVHNSFDTLGTFSARYAFCADEHSAHLARDALLALYSAPRPRT